MSYSGRQESVVEIGVSSRPCLGSASTRSARARPLLDAPLRPQRTEEVQMDQLSKEKLVFLPVKFLPHSRGKLQMSALNR